jgi:hypothetical protein
MADDFRIHQHHGASAINQRIGTIAVVLEIKGQQLAESRI